MSALMLIPMGAGLILVSDLIGNLIAFKNRVTNAVVTSIVWCGLFVALVFIIDQLFQNIRIWERPQQVVTWTLAGVAFAFIADLIGNYIAFDNRIKNSVITAIVWAVLFFVYLNIVGYE